jgi:hypothetical protein
MFVDQPNDEERAAVDTFGRRAPMADELPEDGEVV